MFKNKQTNEMYVDLIEIFEEEVEKRDSVTPDFVSQRLVERGYCKQTDIVKEFFEKIEKILEKSNNPFFIIKSINELKKKYLGERN